MPPRTLSPEEAAPRCREENFTFETTAEVSDLTRYIGQDRALEAVEFGISMGHRGFNLFVLGPEGSGRHSVTTSYINSKAAAEPSPSDWCYVNNFKNPHRPQALEFPAGQAPVFRREMHDLIDTLRSTAPAIFEGDDFRIRDRSIKERLKEKIERMYHELEERAKKRSITVSRNDQGIMLAPVDGAGEPLKTEAFNKLPKETQVKIEADLEELHEELQGSIHRISVWKREAEEQSRKLKRETAAIAVSRPVETLVHKYQGRDKVVGYLKDAEEDLIERIDDFLKADDEPEGILAFVSPPPSFEQYQVNVLVTSDGQGAPVVYEDPPSYPELHGRVEHQARMGVLSTHFSLIKPGMLHRANGGFVIIDARRLLIQPYAYEGLKRTLRSGEVRIEPVEHLLGLMSTVTLEPEPIPLRVKVVLVGDPSIYYLLTYYDPEFKALFKVQADFEYDMDRDAESEALYAALIAGIARNKELLPLHRGAVARVIDQAVREAGDRDKLSLRIRDQRDLMQEADYLARRRAAPRIEAGDVLAAVATFRRRGGRIRDQIHEAIQQQVHRIETHGAMVGQVNGLSVIDLGRDSFGFPTRITALTRPGKGDVIDIEREVELGGPIHSKGVLILSAFLGARYVRDMAICLHASLVFEQSYGGVEGDSASCAELCALLSSLADLPLRQDLAITGSVSQRGEVQAVGGLNEKIEGFFRVCATRGLSGSQGVIVPEANVRHLMLDDEVAGAVAAGRFTLYAVATVDEAIGLLTGREPGVRGEDGEYPEDSVNGRVEDCLRRFALDLRDFDKGGEPEDPAPPPSSPM